LYDKAEIRIKAGDGGDGAISFRHEKYVPYGGPDGGDGGDGGNVIVTAEPGVSSLRNFRHNKLYSATRGGNGGGQKKHGKNGEDLKLGVPIGTVVTAGSGENRVMLADCMVPGQEEIIAVGGKGGKGNVHFASSTNQAPRIAQKGEAIEETTVTLELMLIADIGIIGFPNAGKSTLLTSASAARPKIASYPFTTLEPVLGTVEAGLQSYVWAEIPGLIEGAHLGKGLGHDFLRHIMRTRILVHLIDGVSDTPVDDMVKVNAEMAMYDTELAKKPQIIAVNKIDIPGVKTRREEISRAFADVGTPVMFISAETGEGVPVLVAEAVKLLEETGKPVKISSKISGAVFRPQPRGDRIKIRTEEGVYIIDTPELERIIERVDLANPEVVRQLQRPMEKLGIRKALERAGVRPGDKVRCGEFEWEW